MQHKADGYCYLCAKLYGNYERQENLQEHHVIFGRANRKLSEKYGLKVYLCLWHHTEGKESVHHNKELRQQLEEDAQRAFLKTHSMDEWMAIFGRNFIKSETPDMKQRQQPDSLPHLVFKPKTDNEPPPGFMFLNEEDEEK
jgi:hypothetical protein